VLDEEAVPKIYWEPSEPRLRPVTILCGSVSPSMVSARAFSSIRGVLGRIRSAKVTFMAEPRKTVIDECIIVIYDDLSSKDESETVIF
jgi:hypothetical protein